MAVAPMLTSHNTRCTASSARTSPASVSPKALNSWPSVMGTASCSCVRPIFRILSNSTAFAWKDAISCLISASMRTLPNAIPIWSAVGYASFVDCEQFT